MEIAFLVLITALFIVLSIAMGLYMKRIICYENGKLERGFSFIERPILRFLGKENEKMDFKEYFKALIFTNLIMFLLCFIILFLFSGFSVSLTFNTIISFVTNTDLQHYAGENLPVAIQGIVIMFLMFTSSATGVAVAFAFIRGISGKFKSLGNFFEDFVKIIIRILLPLAFLISILLMANGVPQTIRETQVITTLDGEQQTIQMGPVATFEAIKNLGTNGGGYFGANSAHPFENPTPITNIIEMLSMMILPGGMIFAFGFVISNRKQSIVLFTSCFTIFLALFALIHFGEMAKNTVLSQYGINSVLGNMEGKEARFPGIQSTLFTAITTTATTGSVNCTINALSPLATLGAMLGMMLNSIFGGDGVGFINIITYVILSVFICGLMVGKTPEFLGKRIEPKEMRCIASSILISPLIILIPLALTLVLNPASSAISDYHGLSKMLYEYTSAAANNGSLMEGLADTTVYWNLMTSLVMILGRFASMGLMLYVSYSLMNKPSVEKGVGSFRCDSVLFYVILTVIILVIGALTFFPALCLGPIAEQLQLIR